MTRPITQLQRLHLRGVAPMQVRTQPGHLAQARWTVHGIFVRATLSALSSSLTPVSNRCSKRRTKTKQLPSYPSKYFHAP